MDFLNVATYGTSSKNTKVLVLDGNTVKSRTTSEIISDAGVSTDVGRIMFVTASEGWSETIAANSNNPGVAVPVGAIRRFVIGLKPSAYRLSFWQYGVCANNTGVRAQFSTSQSFTSVVNTDVVYSSYDESADVMRTGFGTIALSSSAPYYVRFLFYNNTASPQNIAVKDISLEVWN
jgi:hypothetical protein